jgi:SRSO17 transposase
VEADRLLDRMTGRFFRVETRRRAGKFVLGLLADLPRKNCWSIAEYAGDRDSHGMQHLLARASWDTDGVRDDLRDYVIAAVGDIDGVLVVDETDDVKKGVQTVGVQRQYTGNRRTDRVRPGRGADMAWAVRMTAEDCAVPERLADVRSQRCG